MSKEYKLIYEDKFTLRNRGEIITVRWRDNNCGDIKVGDTITELVRIRDGETDNALYEVTGIERFEKAFHQVGDNIAVLIKPKQIRMIKLRKPTYSKGPSDLVVIIPTIIFQKLDWRLIMENEGGINSATITYTIHLRWFKMQLAICLNYKKQR
jgi:hypothetical protein